MMTRRLLLVGSLICWITTPLPAQEGKRPSDLAVAVYKQMKNEPPTNQNYEIWTGATKENQMIEPVIIHYGEDKKVKWILRAKEIRLLPHEKKGWHLLHFRECHYRSSVDQAFVEENIVELPTPKSGN